MSNLKGNISGMNVLRGTVASSNSINGNVRPASTIQGQVCIGGIQMTIVDPNTVKQLVEDCVNEKLSLMEPTVTIGTVELIADKWVGSGNLYSQVVSIDGVTKHSQVDLTPDVEQLVVFYEKDLTFVTENEGGIVTVYAIGQKPANNYTIQVTITEVGV